MSCIFPSMAPSLKRYAMYRRLSPTAILFFSCSSIFFRDLEFPSIDRRQGFFILSVAFPESFSDLIESSSTYHLSSTPIRSWRPAFFSAFFTVSLFSFLLKCINALCIRFSSTSLATYTFSMVNGSLSV